MINLNYAYNILYAHNSIQYTHDNKELQKQYWRFLFFVSTLKSQGNQKAKSY